ncbi:MAG: DUF3810 domain-containing protein [Clostridiaceae bacterium]|jgi:hypothetical protein|nr:DUF3810 domain-containing protein [Clostridiaceae bacterium]
MSNCISNYINKHGINRKKIAVSIIVSIALISLIQLVKGIGLRNPGFIEKYFSNGTYPITSTIQTSIANIFPFSLYEIVIVALIGFFIYRLVRLIRSFIKKDYVKELVNFVTLVILLVSIGLFLFQFLWSLNNYRYPLSVQVGLDVKETSVNELAQTYKALVLRANDARSALSSAQYTSSRKLKTHEILNTAWEGYPPLADKYPIFHSRRVRVKGLTFSRIQTISGYSGVYSFITGEPNINIEAPLTSMPHTACHEIAHQMGISFEDDANYAGFLACINHHDPLFVYSGYLSAITYTGNTLYRQSPELYNQISSLLSENIIKDQQENNAFWNQYKNDTVTKIADKINDNYLKSNNQPDGVQSYGKFVDLLIADYFEDNSI